MIGLISAGSISAGVWLWNIIDVKKSKSREKKCLIIVILIL